jgi:hypothetical protein
MTTNSQCAQLIQKFLPVKLAYTSIVEHYNAFLTSPQTTNVPHIGVLSAGFEEALQKYQKEYKGNAKNIIDNYMQKYNSGWEATHDVLTIDPADGRAHYRGRIDLHSSTTDFFPSLIKSIKGNVKFGTKQTSIPYIEEIDGHLNSWSKTKFSANHLKNVGGVDCEAEGTVEFLQLDTASSISLRAKNISLPKLKKAHAIEIFSTFGKTNRPVNVRLELPELIEILAIEGNMIKSLNIPKLKELNYIYVAEATRINAPQLEKVTFVLDIRNLDRTIAFRDAFKQLRQIGANSEGVSVYVKDEERKAEISGLRWKGLTWTGQIQVKSS